MHHKTLISVIIPVYKVEAYLEKCITSVLAQTYENLEVILVDDGSPDNCGSICDWFAGKDSRVRVLHQKNGGLSAARNAGIELANGEFIGFVDGDDWIDPDMYETLYENICTYDADISACGWYIQTSDGTERFNEDVNMTECKVLSAHEAIKESLEFNHSLDMYAWNKLYKKSIFEEEKFPVGMLYEDTGIMVRFLDQAKRVVLSAKPKYHYVYRTDAITKSAYKEKDMDLIDAVAMRYEYVTSHYPDLALMTMYRGLPSYFEILDKMVYATIPVKKEDRKRVIQYLRRNLRYVLQHPKFSIGRKAATLGLMVNKRIYEYCLRKAKKRKENRLFRYVFWGENSFVRL